MAIDKNDLEIFGEFFVNNTIDKGLDRLYALRDNKLKSSSTQELRIRLSNLSEEEFKVVENSVVNVLITTVHDFLFRLEENSEMMNLMINSKNIATLSDGLTGELFSTDGWINKYSSYASKLQKEI